MNDYWRGYLKGSTQDMTFILVGLLLIVMILALVVITLQLALALRA